MGSCVQHTKYLLFTMAITNDHDVNAPRYTVTNCGQQNRNATLYSGNIERYRHHHIGFTPCTTVMCSLFHAIRFANTIVLIILSIFILCWFIIISFLLSIFPQFCFNWFVRKHEFGRSCRDEHTSGNEKQKKKTSSNWFFAHFRLLIKTQIYPIVNAVDGKMAIVMTYRRIVGWSIRFHPIGTVVLDTHKTFIFLWYVHSWTERANGH